MMRIDPQSFRALAYEIKGELTASMANDDNRLGLPLIEQALREQFGVYQKTLDNQKEQRGYSIEPERLSDIYVDIPGEKINESADLPFRFVNFNGGPHITRVGYDDLEESFTPVNNAYQAKSLVKLDRKPVYWLSRDKINFLKTPDTVLVSEIKITGALADPFPTAGRGDEWYWKRPWNVSLEAKGIIKLQVIRELLQTHIAMRPYADLKNNATSV